MSFSVMMMKMIFDVVYTNFAVNDRFLFVLYFEYSIIVFLLC